MNEKNAVVKKVNSRMTEHGQNNVEMEFVVMLRE